MIESFFARLRAVVQARRGPTANVVAVMLVLMSATTGLSADTSKDEPLVDAVGVNASLGDAPLGPDGRIHVPGDAFVERLLEGASYQVRLGAESYHLVCAACHGNSGLGLEEGRAAFPASHQRCERCHRPSNPATLPNNAIAPRNAFSTGVPPALRGQAALDAFPTVAVLYAYIRTSMPRYQPGLLRDDEYLAIAVFLSALNERLPGTATVELGGGPANPSPGATPGEP